MIQGRQGSRLNGFTLIELMIVLAIIGILAAMIIPNLLDAKSRSQQRATMAEMRNWAIGLGAYMSEVGKVPAAAGGGPVDVSTIHNLLVPYALSALHDQDSWKNDLVYFASSDGTSDRYTVASSGRDGAPAPLSPAALSADCITPATWFIYDMSIAISDGIFICSPS